MLETYTAREWVSTALGDRDQWSAGLRSIVDLVLAHDLPTMLVWGKDRVQIFNDSYRHLLAEDRVTGFGQTAGGQSAELWSDGGVIHRRVLAGETLRFEDMRIAVSRGDGLDDGWFTVTFSPVRDDDRVAGTLVSLFETTTKHMLAARSDAAAASLKASEERFRAFVNASSDVVYRMDADWSEMRELDGRGILTDTREPSWNWQNKYILPEDWPLVEPEIRRAIDEVRMFEMEHRIRLANGAIGWTLSRAVPILAEDGTIQEWLGAAKDITSRKISEQSLQHSERRLEIEVERSALLRDLAERLVTEDRTAEIHEDILRTAISITDADAGTFQIYDPETRALVLLATSGFSPTMTDYFHRVDADSNTACGRALKLGTRVFADFREGDDDIDCRMHVEAGYRSAQATPLVSRSGDLIGMLNTHWREPDHRPSENQLRFLDLLARQAADLIEQRRAGEELRRSEERLRQFGEASQDVLWIRDARTLQWEYLTPAFEAIYGLSREDALGGDNFRSWIELVVPEDRKIAEDAMRRVRGGEHVTFDYRIRRPSDGTVRWLRNTDFPIEDASGEVALIGGIGHDFTELRAIENRLTTLLEGIPQLVWRAVDRGEWTWSSPQWTEFTGLTVEESLGKGWLAALHPDDRQGALQFWDEARKSGALAMEARILQASTQDYRWFQSRATPVRDEAGTIIEWLGTSTDINDVRELQDRQRVLVAELQHRTRNLLGVVRSMSDKTARASLDLEDFTGRFRNRLDALSRVQGLLSRLDENDRITFDELLHTELAAMDGSAERVVVKGPTGIRMRSSTVQILALALHELATNAMKYGALRGRRGKLTISWSLAQERDGGRPMLDIDWRETGVEVPCEMAHSRRSGQGRELIEKALPYQFSAKTSYKFEADGLHCRISIPVSESRRENPDHV
ncbi:hypothetical protein B2G71_21530 [Novosphingobium sp. PC22D]|uniref:PAS domain-containing protein n=1 Tax=Novosphingobium sp. PC22D TaxID=1962403 RepID=UPI000BF12C8E|nr:PAS domain-containing protein [Novosphingobium sp. PC22D]PEQ10567.1 hypothetical protein B2G71_21530 [Novosphingobium sp. PC22D]